MSMFTAAGKAKVGRRGTHGASASSGGGGAIQGGSNSNGNGNARPDITDEQKQEIREAFDLFVRCHRLPCRVAPRRAEPGRQWAAQQGRRDASVCTVIWKPPS
jgi:hypothetical protein